MQNEQPGDITLRLRPEHWDGCPPAVRVRRLLKIAGRQLGLRCLAAAEIPDPVKGDCAAANATSDVRTP
jgi:hypothetical protein